MPRRLRLAWAASAAEVTALIEGMSTTFLAETAETGRAAFARAGSL